MPTGTILTDVSKRNCQQGSLIGSGSFGAIYSTRKAITILLLKSNLIQREESLSEKFHWETDRFTSGSK